MLIKALVINTMAFHGINTLTLGLTGQLFLHHNYFILYIIYTQLFVTTVHYATPYKHKVLRAKILNQLNTGVIKKHATQVSDIYTISDIYRLSIPFKFQHFILWDHHFTPSNAL